MDWVHCNSCCCAPNKQNSKFYVTSCGHIYCSNCFGEKIAITNKCVVCSSNCTALEINSHLKPEIQICFMNLTDVVKKLEKQLSQVKTVVNFQSAQHKLLAQRLNCDQKKIYQITEYCKVEAKKKQDMMKEMESLKEQLHKSQEAWQQVQIQWQQAQTQNAPPGSRPGSNRFQPYQNSGSGPGHGPSPLLHRQFGEHASFLVPKLPGKHSTPISNLTHEITTPHLLGIDKNATTKSVRTVNPYDKLSANLIRVSPLNHHSPFTGAVSSSSVAVVPNLGNFGAVGSIKLPFRLNPMPTMPR